MKGALEEYGGLIVQFLIAVVLVGLTLSFIDADSGVSLGKILPKNAEKSAYSGDFSGYNSSLPVLETVTGTYITQGSEVDLLSDEYVLKATSAGGEDLRDRVQVANIRNIHTGDYIDDISKAEPGVYDVSYVLVLKGKNKLGERAKSKMRVIVEKKPSEDEETEEDDPEDPEGGGIK